MSRSVTIRDDGAPPSIVVPKGRTVAERRLGAIAALHQPIPRVYRDALGRHDQDETIFVCGECKTANDMGRMVPTRWPCATARMLGPWPGEDPE